MPSLVHPLIQTARGALADEDYTEAERLLAQAVEAAKDLEEERERYRNVLLMVEENRHRDDCDGLFEEPGGCWGDLARGALRADR